MRTYKEYYRLAKKEQDKWYSWQKDEWWRKKTKYDEGKLDPKGDYIETVDFLSEYDKNDNPTLSNHINVRNSEIDILFAMVAQALIDWCVENNETDFYAYSIEINRTLDEKMNDVLDYTHFIKTIKKDEWEECADEKKLEKFNECSAFLTDLVYEFISRQGKNIPNDWNTFTFGLDAMESSCQWKEWVPDSDGWMHLGNLTNGEWEKFIECM